MNTENFHDALNHLDDDLIRETDQLRRGQRVLYREPGPRRLLRALAPAACVALLVAGGVGLAGRNSAADSAAEQGPVIDSVAGSQSNFGINEAPEAASLHWQQISQGRITLSIPADWEHELEKADDGSYFIVVRPPKTIGEMKIGYSPNFGVCGTGLTVKQTTIAGMEATAGYYDDGMYWSFITFRAGEKQYVVLRDSTEAWWDAHGETAVEILSTIEINAKE